MFCRGFLKFKMEKFFDADITEKMLSFSTQD